MKSSGKKNDLDERLERCAIQFEANLRDFEGLADQASKTVFRRIWNHGLYRELVAESRERLERSRLLLYLSRQLLENQRKSMGPDDMGPSDKESTT